MLLLGIQLAVSASLYYVSYTAGVYFVMVSLSFFCEGGHFCLFPALCAKKFGKRTGGQLYGVLFCAFSISGLMGFVIQQFVVAELGYELVFLILTVMAAASVILTVFWLDETPVYFREETQALLELKVED